MDGNFYIENEVYVVIPKEDYEIAVLTGVALSLNPFDDNVDVEVRFKDGRLFTATFFTIQNIKTLLEKYKTTGECGGGLYFYGADMIMVETISIDIIIETVESLLKEGSLEQAFKLENVSEEGD